MPLPSPLRPVPRTPHRSAIVVALFAVAMAWMESATVVYLRTLVGRIDPYQVHPLPNNHTNLLGPTELVRELATLVMLVTLGWVAGRNPRGRLGYFLIAFGVWDIFYYVFLNVICGWPKSLLDWDVLFLIPLPWWGPVLSPMLIALLMVVGGFLLSLNERFERVLWPRRWSSSLAVIGTVWALYLFMIDAIHAAPQGIQRLRELLPVRFPWLPFLAALALMALPVLDLAWQLCRKAETPARARPNELSEPVEPAPRPPT